jgi:hypothetical protein
MAYFRCTKVVILFRFLLLQYSLIEGKVGGGGHINIFNILEGRISKSFETSGLMRT